MWLIFFTFLVFPTKGRPLTYAEKSDDLLFNDEEFWARNEEKLDEKASPWLDTSVVVDALLVKGRPGVGVGETPTDILSDWLDTLGPYDMNTVDDGDIVRVRVDMIFWDAGK